MIELLREKGVLPYKPTQHDIAATMEVMKALIQREEIKTLIEDQRLLDKLSNPNLFGISEEKAKAAKRYLKAIKKQPSIDPLEAESVLEVLSKEKFSPKIPKVQEKKLTREEKQLSWEADHTLGLEPTSPNIMHWRIMYLPPDPNVEYRERIGKDSIKNFYPGEPFSLLREHGSPNGGFALSSYQISSSSNRVPSLVLYTNNYYQHWILRDESTTEIDASVVKFENLRDGEIRFYAFKMALPDKQTIDVTSMEKVERKNG